jgi:pimeloyl-ACP methyl ester carboxylesterase
MVHGPTPHEHLGRQVLRALRFRSDLVDTSVGPVHLWSADGSGPLPPIVVFHGFASSGMHWVPLLTMLRPRARSVMAIDLPGHGFSTRPEVLTLDVLTAGVLEALDARLTEPVVLVGNSLGGAAATRFLAARPEKVKGAVLFSPAGAPMSDRDLEEVRARFRIDRHEEAVQFVRTLSGRGLGVQAHLMAPLLRRSLGDPVLRSWLASVRPDQFLTAEEVRGLRAPLLVVWGKQERVLPESGREFWRANLPAGSTLVEPDGFGHTPFLDDRRWTVETIAQFAAAVA